MLEKVLKVLKHLRCQGTQATARLSVRSQNSSAARTPRQGPRRRKKGPRREVAASRAPRGNGIGGAGSENPLPTRTIVVLCLAWTLSVLSFGSFSAYGQILQEKYKKPLAGTLPNSTPSCSTLVAPHLEAELPRPSSPRASAGRLSTVQRNLVRGAF